MQKEVSESKLESVVRGIEWNRSERRGGEEVRHNETRKRHKDVLRDSCKKHMKDRPWESEACAFS
jgi:hypothetical protein